MIKSVERILMVLLLTANVASPCLASDDEFDGVLVEVKKEPSDKRERSDFEEESLIPSWPMHTLKSLASKSIKKKINPSNGKDNCLSCCVAFFNLTHSNILEVAPKDYRAQYNIELFEHHAVLINQDDANKLKVKQHCLVINNETMPFIEELNDKRIIFHAFDANTIEEVLSALPLNIANGGNCVSGLLYFDWLHRKKKTYITKTLGDEEVREGHFFNLYIYQEFSKDRTTLLVDPQLGEVLTIEDFIISYKACIGRKAYIWTEKKVFSSPFDNSKIKSDPAAVVQSYSKKAKVDDLFSGPVQAAFKTEPLEAFSTFSEEVIAIQKEPVEVVALGKTRIKLFKPPESLFKKVRPVDIDLVSEELEEQKKLKKLKIKLKVPPAIKAQAQQTYTGPQSQSPLFSTRVTSGKESISLISYLLRDYLDPTDSARFAQTSQSGRALAAKYHYRMSTTVYKELYKETTKYEDDILNTTRDFLFASPEMRSLDLSEYESKNGVEFRIFLTEIAERNKKLKRLNLSSTLELCREDNYLLVKLATACPDLEEISLENLRDLSASSLTAFLERCRNLRKLNLSNVKFRYDGQAPFNIEVIFKNKQLTHLDLGGMERTRDLLINLASQLPKLAHLNIDKNYSCDLIHHISFFLRNRPNMKSLSFGKCITNSNDLASLNELITEGKLNELEHFNIAGPEMIHSFLDNLLTKCKKLRTLKFTGGENMFSEHTARLMREHPTLESVVIESDLENCLHFKLDFRQKRDCPSLHMYHEQTSVNYAQKLGIDFEQLSLLAKHFPAIKALTFTSLISRENLLHIMGKLATVESLTLGRFFTFNENDGVHLTNAFSSKKSLRYVNISVENIPLSVIRSLVKKAGQINTLVLRGLKLEKFQKQGYTQEVERLNAEKSDWLNIELHTIDDSTYRALSARPLLFDEKFKLVLTDN
ncbi:MAG: hypothetical protein KBB83_03455 [Alphaproteobacteria bacterium]|nr:hypothetical protein [Alphaproteobacteria bacterium]